VRHEYLPHTLSVAHQISWLPSKVIKPSAIQASSPALELVRPSTITGTIISKKYGPVKRQCVRPQRWALQAPAIDSVDGSSTCAIEVVADGVTMI
jgi:hypothetical protein